MENTIKEDIKILENFINWLKIDFEYDSGEEIKAIEHILSDYKRVLKENEELKEDRDKFKKALGRRITYCNELEKDLFENGSNYVIPKQKVKDKIEEIDKKIKREENEKVVLYLHKQRKVLQELLEENENHIPRID